MKQHIKTVHKALKRTADEGENSEEPQNKINKKEEAIIDDYNLVDMDIPTDTQSQTLNSTVADFCNGLLGHPLLENEETLNLDLSLVNPKYLEEHLHSTVLSDDDVLPPDQDHSEFNNIFLLRAKLLSTEMEVKKKSTQIVEKDNELTAVKEEAAELAEQVFSLGKEVRESKENLELAMGKINSHEEENRQLKNKLKLYNAAIRKMKEDRNFTKDNSAGSDKAIENELRKQVKNKSRELVESETRCRKLGQRLAELESTHRDNSASKEDKYKVVNEKLNVKTKELKNAESNLKKSEARVKELIDKVAEKNKKISEL